VYYHTLVRLDESSIFLPTFAADADNLMEGLMPHGGPEVHWVDSARLLGSGIAMHLRRSMDRWSLPDVYATTSDSHLYEFCEDEIAKLTDDADPESPPDEAIEHIVNRLSRFRGDAASDNREIRSVVSTAITKLGWLSNRPIAENMRKSTVDFKQMRERPMTVYVVAPGKYLRTFATWLRTITTSWADACLHEAEGDVSVLGVLDEFKTSVGNLSSISTLNAMGAGYGVTLLTVNQDLNQLRKLMPDGWQTYLANSAFQMFCAPGAGDMVTSEHLSKMTGTIEVRSVSKSTGKPGPGFQIPVGPQGALNSLSAMTAGNGDQLNISQQGRRYMLPEEVREMSDTEALTFARGVKGVIRSGRRPYYEDPTYFMPDGKPKFDEDPYHAKKSKRRNG
jgi:type IV secretory pathway TraG/TraD family ATPase VirD4